MKRVSLFMLLCLAISTVSFAGSDLIVFSCDFEDGTTSGVTYSGVSAIFSGVTTLESTQGFSSYGFGDTFLRNASTGDPASATILTLTNLPEHTSIEIIYDFCTIESWDGGPSDPEGYAHPDYFNMNVDGTSVFAGAFHRPSPSSSGYMDETYWNEKSSIPQDDPRVILLGEQLMMTHWDPDPYYEAAYHMGEDEEIIHTGSTLFINWFASGSGWQGGNDESWAIDNITIILHGVDCVSVPVPGAVSLSMLGMGFVGWFKRRRSL